MWNYPFWQQVNSFTQIFFWFLNLENILEYARFAASSRLSISWDVASHIIADSGWFMQTIFWQTRLLFLVFLIQIFRLFILKWSCFGFLLQNSPMSFYATSLMVSKRFSCMINRNHNLIITAFSMSENSIQFIGGSEMRWNNKLAVVNLLEIQIFSWLTLIFKFIFRNQQEPSSLALPELVRHIVSIKNQLHDN